MAQSGSASDASSTGFCDRSKPTTAVEQDRILRFAAVVREELNQTDATTVLVARSGLDLSRFQIRYSHAAILTRSDNGSWNARQLYYACDEGQPRIFDQGLAGFAGGGDDLSTGYLSIVTMPPDAAQALHDTSQNNALALSLLAQTYSANAYPFSTRYQNCNQWVIELLAVAWGNLPAGDDLRGRAQRWLVEEHYDPEPIKIGNSLLLLASLFTPMLHLGDHPEHDIHALALQVSLPSTIEAFVLQRQPVAGHIEFCHTESQVVVHHGWTPIENGCHAVEGDRVVSLE